MRAAAQKGKNKVGQTKAGAPAAGECFKCGREGHYQSECQFEPLCVICSGEGPASVSCPSRGKTLRLQSMGHAITGGGFYNIDVVPLGAGQGARESFSAVIKFKDEPLQEDKLTEELKLLVDDLWDWQVTKQYESEFTVVFPSRATLRLATTSGKLFLPLSEKETEIREAFLAPKPSLVLPSTWVRLSGVLEDLMTKERLMAAFVMVGRPIDVDELSILKHDREPIRIRFQGRFPDRMKGSIQVLVNGEGYTVTLQTEAEPRGGAGGSNGGPPPPPWRDREDVDSDEMSSDDEWNKHRTKSTEQEKEKGKDTVPGTGKGLPPSRRTSLSLLAAATDLSDRAAAAMTTGAAASSASGALPATDPASTALAVPPSSTASTALAVLPSLARLLATSATSQMASYNTTRPLHLEAGSFSSFSSGAFPPPPPNFAMMASTIAAASPLAGTNLSGPPIPLLTAPAASPAIADAPASADGAAPTPYQLTNLITVRLKPDNYLYWRAQILPLLRSRRLDGFVDGSLPCPSRTVAALTANGTRVEAENPLYAAWVAQDQAIVSALQSSLMEGVAGLVLFVATSYDIWRTFEQSYAQ
ncbi:hypothetical protein QYE76_071790 [Lolium multiflorum]|uniref:CCHC-type domain-containing protein n=1 Tax=Lolium multiflorum TaxID=4521 RepID=A0AAD8SMW2_LOLMU|nr:hypothetical protein QYE76_071790 [Lolium multiflorum]